jgi:hypothetical protein
MMSMVSVMLASRACRRDSLAARADSAARRSVTSSKASRAPHDRPRSSLTTDARTRARNTEPSLRR